MAEVKAGFFAECEELLEDLMDGLDALASGQATTDNFNAVFRAAHSIKGGAAAFGMSDLVDFAHGLETRLVVFRDASELPSGKDIPALQSAADRLATLVGLAAQGIDISEEERLDDAAMLARSDISGTVRETRFRLSGDSAGTVLSALGELGHVEAVLNEASVPALEHHDPRYCRLSWEVSLHSDVSKELLEKALRDLDPEGALEALGEIEDPGKADSTPLKPVQSTKNLKSAPTIRVELDRIDRLINLVGELVINQAMLARSSEELGFPSNSDHSLGLEELMRLTRNLQDSVMQIRAQPVKPLFQRMARICREAALTADKQVEFMMEGQETEIDKTLIERLVDPLTHMIRNAVDHAIERPNERASNGKPRAGRITLRASHRSGQVILEVLDDGTGIDRKKILKRARDKGLIPLHGDPSPLEIDHLLFTPGFSTVDEVSALSGRGVGMDVVRASVQALGGRISIDSRLGRGTRFEIALPLTLAVLDGMIVSTAGETLVFPLSSIQETLTVSAEDVLDLGPGHRILRHVGQGIALVDLGEALGYHGYQTNLEDRVALIVKSEGKAPVAIIIDEIYEQRQVVIKGLQEGFTAASAVVAATILGDGRIALIIDPFDPTLSPEGTSAARKATVPLELST